jgi:hypothetical protein
MLWATTALLVASSVLQWLSARDLERWSKLMREMNE